MPSTVVLASDLVAALREAAEPSGEEGASLDFRADSDPVDHPALVIPPGRVFAVAKRFTALPVPEVESLLESPAFDVRLAAVSVMDFEARAKRTPDERRRALYDLYLRRHDRINGWGLVDRAAPYVVGGYLADRPRHVLDELARSENPWERRTAIVATYFFIRMDQTEDTFRIAESLVHDDHRYVQLAVGSWVREAGKRDPDRLLAFLDAHAETMPRPMLRYATEKLDPITRAAYL